LHGIEIDENRYKTSEERVEKEGKNEIELIHGDFNDLYLETTWVKQTMLHEFIIK